MPLWFTYNLLSLSAAPLTAKTTACSMTLANISCGSFTTLPLSRSLMGGTRAPSLRSGGGGGDEGEHTVHPLCEGHGAWADGA